MKNSPIILAAVVGMGIMAAPPLFAQTPSNPEATTSSANVRRAQDWFPRIGRIADAEGPEEDEPLETDRDSFTPATKVVSKGRVIFESAYSFIDNKGIPETHSFPELLVRYGVTNRLELRLGWNYEVGGAGNEVSGSQADTSLEEIGSGSKLIREQRISYGFKWQVSEQQGWIPQSAVILQGATPTGGDSNATYLAGTYVFGWKLANEWKTDFAIRYATGSEEGDHFNVWAPSAVLRVPLGERWSVHGEYFGLFSQDKSAAFARHFFSTGAHYLVTSDLEVGVRVGWGLNEQTQGFFANAGFGLRF
jgi:hypothetical protein